MNEKSAVNPPVVSPGAPVGVRKVYRPAGLGPVGAAGAARGGKAVAVERPGQRVLRGGWVFVYWMAGLVALMAAGLVACVKLDNELPAGVLSKAGQWHLHPSAKMVAGFGFWVGWVPLSILGSVYSIIWMLVPIVAICQGRASAGIAYLFASPLLLVLAALVGGGIGLLLR